MGIYIRALYCVLIRMRTKSTIIIGKTVRKLAKLRGGGSALPGLVVEKLDRGFVGRMLADLPYGVVVVSGTNGKTTTTKIVSELLEASGLRVFTNKTGSNFVRGIAAAIINETTLANGGKLPHDIAVLELDEAHAVQFIRIAQVNHALLLNVMRDQLDRFGEIDYTARLLEKVADATTTSLTLNRDDPRISNLAANNGNGVAVQYFGAHPTLHHVFVNDDALHQPATKSPVQASEQGPEPTPATTLDSASVELTAFTEHTATFSIGGKTYATDMRLTGVYNFLNAAGALALCRQVLGDKVDDSLLIKALATIKPAFGRGETININGQDIELVLVKNPAGFRLALASFDPTDTAVMIAINDMYADGRDMSWLWDVDFSSLAHGGVDMVTGVRAYDMALRLQYDQVASRAVEPDLGKALESFIMAGPSTDGSTNQAHGIKRIFCTYTAMLTLRRQMRKYTKIGIME